MNVLNVLLWGFVATVVLTGVLAGSQIAGLSRMSLPLMLGTMFTPNRDRALVVGSGLHLINGWIFALIYALAFESVGFATWWAGAVGGVIHGCGALLFVLPMLPGIHPRMASTTQGPEPTRGLEPPGFLGLNYGQPTAVFALVAHVAYGTILGAFYQF